MGDATYDRTTQDVGNIVALEHVNVTVVDPTLAGLFYVSGLGFTRDPFIDFGTLNMWVNVGSQQIHLPRGPESQVLRGTVGGGCQASTSSSGGWRSLTRSLAAN